MNNLENRLKSLRVSQPPDHLKERIFGPEREGFNLRFLFLRRVAVGWAATFSLLMGIIGFLLAYVIIAAPQTTDTRNVKTVNVHVVYQSPESRPVFDFTRSSADFLPGNIDIKIKSKGEVSL